MSSTSFDEALAVFEGRGDTLPPLRVVAPYVPESAVDAFDPPHVEFWKPYPKQALACDLAERVFELLFGGSAGPGKSMALRGHACDWAMAHPGAHIGIVRRTLPQLKQTHGLHLPAMVGEHAVENKVEGTFTFTNGSVIRFISLTNPGDEQKYKSAEFDVLLFDELTEFEETQYTFMLSRVRSARGHPTHVIATSNPEGRGFRWVKRRFVKPRTEDLAEGQTLPEAGVPWAPPIITDGAVTGWQPLRAFLPATLRDNPGLMKSNPGYVQQLESLPDTRLRRALVDGDWDAMDAIPGALWSQDVIDRYRVESAPTLARVVVGVDPSGTSQSGDRECGIVAAGRGMDGHIYVLRDVSGAYTPDGWSTQVATLYRHMQADRVVAERNYGGEMVQSTLLHAEPLLPVELLTSSRGKALRAEPIAALTTRGMVHFVGRIPELEDQMCFPAGTLIETARGHLPIERVTSSDWVMTRAGWAPLRWAGMTGFATELTTVAHQAGCVQSTTWHPIWSGSLREFVPAQSVSPTDHLAVRPSPANTVTPWRGADAGTTARRLATTGTRRGSFSTAPSGRPTTGPSLTATTSTTATRTLGTTSPATWSPSRRWSTSGATGTPGRPSRTMRSGPPVGAWSGRARRLALSGAIGAVAPSSRPGSVRSSVVEVTSELRTRPQPVYDLTVADGYLPEFYANGVLVHNCTWTPTDSWSPDRLDAAVFAVTDLLGGAAALAFLTQVSAPCPECGTPNTSGRSTCLKCGAELPFADPVHHAALPPGVPPPPELELPRIPKPPATPGGFSIAGLILPADPASH